MSQIQQTVNKIMSDGNFRSVLRENPQNALQQAGIEARSAISISFEGFEVPNLDDLNINWLC